jgi:hypothetical protein
MDRKKERERLADWASKFRAKYNPQSTDDLERIAVEEFEVKKVVKTPLALGSFIVPYRDYDNPGRGGGYIFYNASFEPYEKLVLGHEIGHAAIWHLIGPMSQSEWRQQTDATFFSLKLNNVSAPYYYYCMIMDIASKIRDIAENKHLRSIPTAKKAEIDRLRQLDVLDAFIYGHPDYI